MKYAIRTLALAATLAASGWANAASVDLPAGGGGLTVTYAGHDAVLTFKTGSGTLEFSNGTGVLGGVPKTAVGGLVGALNVGKVTLTEVDGSVITQKNVKLSRSSPRGIVTIAAGVTGLKADDQTGAVTSVTSFGGAQQDANFLDGVLDGGRVTVKNLRFDLTNKVVYADMTGQALNADNTTYGPLQTSLNTPLWNITTIDGPTVMPPSAIVAASRGNTAPLQSLGYTLTAAGTGYDVSASNQLKGLMVTSTGFDFFATSLGLTPGSTGYTTLQGVNGQPDGWGSVQSSLSLHIEPTIPEPASYALALAGLAVMVGVQRRRQKA